MGFQSVSLIVWRFQCNRPEGMKTHFFDRNWIVLGWNKQKTDRELGN